MKFNHLFFLLIIFCFGISIFNDGFAQQAQWIPIGPWGGNVSDLAIDPKNPDILYALVGSEVLQSTNDGAHWELLSNLEDVEVPFYGFLNYPDKLIVNPLNSNELLAATFAYICKSRDQGRTWEVTTDTIGFRYIDIEFNPLNPKTVYAAAGWQTLEFILPMGGIFKSTTSGDSWKFIENELTGKSVIGLEVNPSDTSTLFVSAWDWDGNEFSYAFYKSTDAGTSWTALDVALDNCWVSSISIPSGNPQVIFIGTAGYSVLGCERSMVLKSEDGGTTWANKTSNLPASRTISAVKVDPRNSDWVYVAFRDSGLFKTYDGGTNWIKLNENSLDQFVNDIVILQNHSDTLYIATKLYGIHNSIDAGENWTLNMGDMSLGAPDFVIDPANSNIIHAVSSNGMLKTEDGGKSWNYVYLFKKPRFFLDIANCRSDPDIVYVSTSYHSEIYKTLDRGQSWQAISKIDKEDIDDIVVSPDNPNILYATTSFSGVFKSINGGYTWESKNEGLDELVMYKGSLCINPLNSNNLYASTNDRLYKSFNAGETWHAITPENFIAHDIYISETDTNIVFALTPGHGNLLRSMNSGATWDTLSLPHSGEVKSFTVNPFDPLNIYIGFRYEDKFHSYIFQTKDGGQTWTDISDGLHDRYGIPVAFSNTAAPALYAASRGIYRLDLTTGVNEKETHQPEEFYFFQNYPNPFNAYTNIEYSLPSFTNVKLTIYNILGEEVITLVNKKQVAGRHKLQWNGKDWQGNDASSGIYLLQLKTDHISCIHRMLFIR